MTVAWVIDVNFEAVDKGWTHQNHLPWADTERDFLSARAGQCNVRQPFSAVAKGPATVGAANDLSLIDWRKL